MPFDPAKPAASAPNSSAEMRGQLTALKSLIDAVPVVTSAQVDSTTTGSPGSSAGAGVSLSAGVLHFTFDVPQGQQGPTGEVSQSQLSNDLVNTQNAAVNTALPLTSANSNGVSPLGVSSGDFTVQTVIDKINELINALRR